MKIYIVFSDYEDFMDDTILDYETKYDVTSDGMGYECHSRKAIFAKKEDAEAFLRKYTQERKGWKNMNFGEIKEYEVIE